MVAIVYKKIHLKKRNKAEVCLEKCITSNMYQKVFDHKNFVLENLIKDVRQIDWDILYQMHAMTL